MTLWLPVPHIYMIETRPDPKEGNFMKPAKKLEQIEKQIMNLPVSEQIQLIERIARRVRSVQ